MHGYATLDEAYARGVLADATAPGWLVVTVLVLVGVVCVVWLLAHIRR